jgi:hypothetical protein
MYIEEVTYGTTPAASPVFINAGAIQNLRDTTDITARRYRQLGSEDMFKALKQQELYSFELVYNPVSTTFLRYGTESQGGGAGTIDKSLSMLVSWKLDAVEQFVLFKGCRTDTISIEWTPDNLEVTQNVICQNETTPSTTTGLTTPSYAANNTLTPWMGIDAGLNPLTINSITYPTMRFRIEYTRNLDPVRTVGSGIIEYLVPTIREIEADFDILYKDTASIADTKTLTARAASIPVNSSASKTLTMTDLYLEKYDSELDAEATEVMQASFSGPIKSATITA